MRNALATLLTCNWSQSQMLIFWELNLLPIAGVATEFGRKFGAIFLHALNRIPLRVNRNENGQNLDVGIWQNRTSFYFLFYFSFFVSLVYYY